MRSECGSAVEEWDGVGEGSRSKPPRVFEASVVEEGEHPSDGAITTAHEHAEATDSAK